MNQVSTTDADADTITATVEFSFRGEACKVVAHLSVVFLTELLASGDEGAIHRVIATKGGLDTYSYAYEVMEMQPIHFSDARGLIGSFIGNGTLDTQAYLQAWREATAVSHAETALLAQIARDYLQIDSLADHPALHDALEAAYQAGKATS